MPDLSDMTVGDAAQILDAIGGEQLLTVQQHGRFWKTKTPDRSQVAPPERHPLDLRVGGRLGALDLTAVPQLLKTSAGSATLPELLDLEPRRAEPSELAVRPPNPLAPLSVAEPKRDRWGLTRWTPVIEAHEVDLVGTPFRCDGGVGPAGGDPVVGHPVLVCPKPPGDTSSTPIPRVDPCRPRRSRAIVDDLISGEQRRVGGHWPMLESRHDHIDSGGVRSGSVHSTPHERGDCRPRATQPQPLHPVHGRRTLSGLSVLLDDDPVWQGTMRRQFDEAVIPPQPDGDE
jgi:hypothetical protein